MRVVIPWARELLSKLLPNERIVLLRRKEELPHRSLITMSTPHTSQSEEPRISPHVGEEQEVTAKIRVKIRAYDNKIIDRSTSTIIDTALRAGARVIGPVPLPTSKKKYTILRSTFKYKNARDQYEMRVHKRLIDIINPNPKVIDELSNLNLPAGVDIEIKML